MSGRGVKLASILGFSVMTFFTAGIAGAQGAEALKVQETNATKQRAAPEGAVEEIADAGSGLKSAQSQLKTAASRTQDLDQQIQNLNRDLNAQREAATSSRARLEQRARAAYKGEDLASITLALGSLLGGDSAKSHAALNDSVTRLLTKGRESIQFHQDSQRALKETLQQLDQKKEEYRQSQEEQQSRAEELQRHQAKLEVYVGGSGSKNKQLEARVAQLQAADQAGLFERPPASGGDAGFREQELEITREDIVARPVPPIPYEKYVQIYKASAKRYGFAQDWYVLAAVGKAESNHGENMGPSSAGAMGPMQFLPSTWRQYGIDGNRDGTANIMDPEDAIPAAAAYLKNGGAPDDWYAALYTYNHAGWYVREVLGIAEAYRRQARDDEVEPYI